MKQRPGPTPGPFFTCPTRVTASWHRRKHAGITAGWQLDDAGCHLSDTHHGSCASFRSDGRARHEMLPHTPKTLPSSAAPRCLFSHRRRDRIRQNVRPSSKRASHDARQTSARPAHRSLSANSAIPMALTFQTQLDSTPRWSGFLPRHSQEAQRKPGRFRPGTWMGTVWFPRANERFFCHVKDDKVFRGDVLSCAVQGHPQTCLRAVPPPHRQAPRL